MSDAADTPERVSWRRMLEARPLPNAAAEATEEGEGLRLTVPRERPWWMVPPVSWVLSVRLTRGMRLDRVGARVWRLCDGERTVEQVVDAFAGEYNLTFHEARVAVTGYLRQLVQRGALAIEMPAEDEPA